MRATMRRALDVGGAALAAGFALAISGCQTSQPPSAWGAVFAPSNGSVVGGTVRVIARDDGVAFNLYATGLPPGQFRVVIHANGNCSSRNGFSAGPPWAPPGMAPVRLTLASSTDGSGTLSVRLRGYKLEGPDGLVGKSVVLHEAGGTLEAQPDVRNGRIACGVIGPMRALTF